jgi:hypothetical protein
MHSVEHPRRKAPPEGWGRSAYNRREDRTIEASLRLLRLTDDIDRIPYHAVICKCLGSLIDDETPTIRTNFAHLFVRPGLCIQTNWDCAREVNRPLLPVHGWPLVDRGSDF